MMKLPSTIEFHAIQIVRSILNNQGAKTLVGKAQVEFKGQKSIDVAFNIEPSLTINMRPSTAELNTTLSRSVLSTVRIRMSDFNLSTDDRASITSIRLKFDAPRGKIAFTDFKAVL